MDILTLKKAQRYTDNQKIVPFKTTFVQYKKNLVDQSQVISGYRILGDTGAVVVSADWTVSEWIPVQPSTQYTASEKTYSAVYDGNKRFLEGVNTVDYFNSYTFNIPADGAFIRVSFPTAHLDTYQLEPGGISTGYEPAKLKIPALELEPSSVDSNLVAEQSITPRKASFVNRGKNLFDKNTITHGYLVLGTNGALHASGAWNASDFIPVEPNTQYIATYTFYSAIYDAKFNFISGVNVSDYTTPQVFEIPSNGAFVRVSVPTTHLHLYQLEVGSTRTTYESGGFSIPGLRPQEWAGAKVNIIGDSIVANLSTGYNPLNFAHVVAAEWGFKLNNYGSGGATIAINPATPEERSPIISRYATMANDADLVIVCAGTNDWQYDWTPLGDMSSRNNNEFYGALHNLCLGLIEKYSGKQIMFITPIKRKQAPYDTQESRNANGKTLNEYCSIIKEVCGYYGIPVLDMYNRCILNPHIASQCAAYIPDGTHPTAEGHAIMARCLAGFLRTLK